MSETEMTQKNIQTINPTAADWESVKNLRLEALKNDPQAFGRSYESEAKQSDDAWKEKLARTLGKNPDEILVMAKDGEVYVGMIGAAQKDPKAWYIKAVYVKPAYRGTGVSRQLIGEILRQLGIKKEVQEIELMVNTEQEVAVRLYQAYGFTITEIVKDQKLGDGNVYDEYLMCRENSKNSKR